MGFGICGRLTDVAGAGRYTAVSQALKAAPGDCNNGETESLFWFACFFFSFHLQSHFLLGPGGQLQPLLFLQPRLQVDPESPQAGSRQTGERP